MTKVKVTHAQYLNLRTNADLYALLEANGAALEPFTLLHLSDSAPSIHAIRSLIITPWSVHEIESEDAMELCQFEDADENRQSQSA